MLTKHSSWIVVTTDSREYSNSGSGWSSVGLSSIRYRSERIHHWVDPISANWARIADHISWFHSRPQWSRPEADVWSREPLSGSGTVGWVCKAKPIRYRLEDTLYSTEEPTKPRLCESITSETHFWGKYLVAPNVQSFATSMLARGRAPDDGTEWFAVARDGFNFLSLHWIERTDLPSKDWSESALVYSKSSQLHRFQDWCLLIERTYKSNRWTPFLSTVENLWTLQIMSGCNHAFQRTGSNNMLP